jgi:phage gp45-like
MHRATPLNTSFRAYTAGGARGVVGEVNDSTLMQEVKATFLNNETRDRIEAPQNYGFSSVNMGPDQSGSAEHFSNFMGGNRWHPIASTIDDRRHRLKGLDPGDVSMFRTKDDALQLHLSKDGGFWSGSNQKKLRLQLVAPDQQQSGQQGGGGGGASKAGTEGGAGQAGAATGGAQQMTGQKPVKDKDSTQYIDLGKDMTQSVNKQHQITLEDKKTGMEVNPDGNVYLGGTKGNGSFKRVLVEGGAACTGGGQCGYPAQNVYARSSGSLTTEIAVIEDCASVLVNDLMARVEALEATVAELLRRELAGNV